MDDSGRHDVRRQFAAECNAGHRQYFAYQGDAEVRLTFRHRFGNVGPGAKDEFRARSKIGAEAETVCGAEKRGSKLGAGLRIRQCDRLGHEDRLFDAVRSTHVELWRACAHHNANVARRKLDSRAGRDFASLFEVGQDCRDRNRNISSFAPKQPVPHVSWRPELDANLVPRLALKLRDEARHHRPRSAGGYDFYFRCLDVGRQSKSRTNDNACGFHTRSPVTATAGQFIFSCNINATPRCVPPSTATTSDVAHPGKPLPASLARWRIARKNMCDE